MIEKIKFLKENPSAKTDWWDEISEAEKQAIDQGLADADKGNVVAHQDVRKRYEKRL